MSSPFGLLPLVEQKRFDEFHLAEAKERLAKIIEQWKMLKNADGWDFLKTKNLCEMEVKHVIGFYEDDLNRIANQERYDAERESRTSRDTLDEED
jgi:hypothetical protein